MGIGLFMYNIKEHSGSASVGLLQIIPDTGRLIKIINPCSAGVIEAYTIKKETNTSYNFNTKLGMGCQN